MRCSDVKTRPTALLLALCLAGACGPPSPPPPEAVDGMAAAEAVPGRIVGRVLFDDGRPRAGPIDMSADPQCVALHDHAVAHRDLLFDEEGRLENVLVYVLSGLEPREWEPPAEPRLLDQVGCLFVPRVQGLRAGQTIVVRNGDPTLHNVNAHPENNPEFNFGQPFQGMETELVFANPEEVFRVRCDTHPWMAAYLAVFDHPFYDVTGGDGAFSLDDLPPGEYTIRAWHERLGRRDLQATVGEAETVELEIRLAPRR